MALNRCYKAGRHRRGSSSATTRSAFPAGETRSPLCPGHAQVPPSQGPTAGCAALCRPCQGDRRAHRRPRAARMDAAFHSAGHFFRGGKNRPCPLCQTLGASKFTTVCSKADAVLRTGNWEQPDVWKTAWQSIWSWRGVSIISPDSVVKPPICPARSTLTTQNGKPLSASLIRHLWSR